MQLPNTLEEHLKAQDIPFTVTHHADLDTIAIGIPLQNGHDFLLAVIPADRLLEDHRLADCLGSQPKPLPLNPIPWQQFPLGLAPIPDTQENAKLIAERDLQHRETIHLIGTQSNTYLQLTQADFQRLLDTPHWAHFAISPEQANQLGTDRYTPDYLLDQVHQQHDLPPLCNTGQDLLKLQSNPLAEPSDLAKIIERDPGLVAQLMKWANSPFYGFPGEITSIKDAITKVLGFELVLNMALGVAIGQQFQTPNSGPIGLRRHWETSIFTAHLIDKLVTHLPMKQRPNAPYLSGLLHNIGFLVLGELFPNHFDHINRLIPYNPHLATTTISEFVLGANQHHLGGCLLSFWQLPESLTQAAFYRESPSTDPAYGQLRRLFTITNALLKRLGDGHAATGRIDEALITALDLTPAQVQKVFEDFAMCRADLLIISGQISNA